MKTLYPNKALKNIKYSISPFQIRICYYKIIWDCKIQNHISHLTPRSVFLISMNSHITIIILMCKVLFFSIQRYQSIILSIALTENNLYNLLNKHILCSRYYVWVGFTYWVFLRTSSFVLVVIILLIYVYFVHSLVRN